MRIVSRRFEGWQADRWRRGLGPGARFHGARFGQWSRRTLGAIIVAVSAGSVAGMVASVVLGPVGEQVFARDGYANRDPYASFAPAAPEPVVALPAGPLGAGGADGVRRPRPDRSRVADDGERRGWRHRHDDGGGVRLASLGAVTGKHSVCVRLCDGFFFPVGDVHGAGDLDTQTAVCSNACPGAPTRLFVTPSGTSDIDQAVSIADGRPYTALPVAYAHTAAVGPTCTCHADGQPAGPLMSPLRDITLRDGDSVMTAVGWRVFKGTGAWPYTKRDFTSLAAADHMSKTARSTLAALEDATLGRTGDTAAAAAGPTLLDIRIRHTRVPLKGTDGRMVRLVDPMTAVAQ